jgi:hypothetical protein
MTTTPVPAPQADALRQTQQAFVADILPRVEAHGRVCFRHVRCRHQREELLAEMTALCWKWFVRLVRRGKDALQFVSVLAAFAARASGSGRRVCGQEKSKDVLSPLAQRRRGFCVGRLPDASTLHGNPLDEALADNTRSGVPEQVAFRLDFPAWRQTQADRDRRLIDLLMLGERGKDVSAAFGLSQGRISQKRRWLREDWRRFHGEAGR